MYQHFHHPPNNTPIWVYLLFTWLNASPFSHLDSFFDLTEFMLCSRTVIRHDRFTNSISWESNGCTLTEPIRGLSLLSTGAWQLITVLNSLDLVCKPLFELNGSSKPNFYTHICPVCEWIINALHVFPVKCPPQYVHFKYDHVAVLTI